MALRLRGQAIPDDIIPKSGTEPVIIDYLREGWTRPQLLGLFAAAGLTPCAALRVSKSPAAELGLTDPGRRAGLRYRAITIRCER